jgi:hypothetical protein
VNWLDSGLAFVAGVVATLFVGLVRTVLRPRITADEHIRCLRDDRLERQPAERYIVRIVNRSWWRAAVELDVRVLLRLPYDPSNPKKASFVPIPAQDRTLMVLAGCRARTFGLDTEEIPESSWLFLPLWMRDQLRAGKRLRLQDLLELQDGRARLQVFVAAYDSLTGARRVFQAGEYARADVRPEAFPPYRGRIRRIIDDLD